MPRKVATNAKTPNPNLQFLVDALRKNRKAKYADLRDQAQAKKLTVWPIMYGRAQAIVGIVKQKPRGTGPMARATKARAAAAHAVATESAAPAVSRAPSGATAPAGVGDLFERLDAVAREFRDAIVAALGSASVSEIASVVSGASAGNGRSAAARPAATNSGQASIRSSGSLGGAGSPLKTDIVEALKASAAPLTKRQIARKLRVTEQRVKDALTALRRTKHVNMTGNRRMAVYTAA